MGSIRGRTEAHPIGILTNEKKKHFVSINPTGKAGIR